jgi:hypothetical protein
MTPDERREILERVASGKISAEQAATMLQDDTPAGSTEKPVAEQVIPVEEESSEPVTKTSVAAAEKPPASPDRGRWLHIHVNDLKTGGRRVSVNIPLGLLRAGLNLGGRVAPELHRFDWSEISSALLDEQGGMIVEVKDEVDGEHVQIFVD